MRYTFRPLGLWTEGDTEARRGRSVFKATWPDTLRLLQYELGYLEAETVVLQADFRESDLRVDGTIRANARQPHHPGVRVAFGSCHGPLTYATDSCAFWQHNVRSIALGLAALRAVDRYGVTRRGEQYTGWAQLGPGAATPMNGAMSRDEAFALVVRLHPAALSTTDVADLAADPDLLRRVFRLARAQVHPDRNDGDGRAFLRLEQAGRALGLIK